MVDVVAILAYDDPPHSAPIANPCAVFVRASCELAPDPEVPLIDALIIVGADVYANIFGLLVVSEFTATGRADCPKKRVDVW